MKISLLNGRGLFHVTIFQILEPLYNFGMTKGINLIFDARIDHDMYLPMHKKITHKVGVVRVT